MNVSKNVNKQKFARRPFMNMVMINQNKLLSTKTEIQSREKYSRICILFSKLAPRVTSIKFLLTVSIHKSRGK